MGMVALAAMATGAQALEPGDPGYWDGFYAGILGGVGAGVPPTTGEFINLGIAAGAGATTNDGFYFGAEAFLAGESFNGGSPYLWLEADGRVGFVVGDRVLVFGSGGIAYDGDAAQLALTGGAGAEFAVSDVLAIRGQYVLQYYPSGLGTFHQGLVGLVWHIQ